MLIEPPCRRPPVTPLSVPVTEPRPVLEPVLELLLLLLPLLLRSVPAEALWPSVPDVLAAPAAGMEPDTEFRPGRLLLAGLLGVWKSTGPRFAAFGEPIPDPSTL